MAKILILGAGSMGTAFSFPCSDKNHSVVIIGTHLENSFIDQINSKKIHPSLECDVPINVKFLKFEKLAEEINKKVDLIAIAVSSKGIEWVSTELSKVLKINVPILILTKGLGINNNNYEILADKMERLLKKNGIKETNISAAGGPCLAKGLANRVHTSVVIANTDIKIANHIAESGANVLFVAITSPKKEIFLNTYKKQLQNVNFIMGVGGSFDVIAGKVKRAPLWMQNVGLEWFYRLMQEPLRMWKRYLIGNTKFLVLVLRAFFRKKN